MKYVGINEVLKATRSGDVSKVYIGKDAENHVVCDLIKLCNDNNIQIEYVETMKELGKLAGIEIDAATAAE